MGGHCIGIDPYYLTWKSDKLGYHARVINSGRFVNDAMGAHVGKQVVKRMLAQGRNPLDSRILVMGLTFKEDVADIRNTKVTDVIRELKSYNIEVDVVDPFASPAEVEHEYGHHLEGSSGRRRVRCDCVGRGARTVQGDGRSGFRKTHAPRQRRFADLKGLYRGQINTLEYWSL